MRFRKEPPYQHGSVARTAVVLVNLGTPDAPTHAARAALSEGILVRSARGGNSARAVVADPAWIILPFRAGQIGGEIRADLDPRRLAAEGAYRKAGTAVARLSGRARPSGAGGYAMRYGDPSLPAVLAQAAGRRLPAHPDPAGLSAIFGAPPPASTFDAVFQHYAHGAQSAGTASGQALSRPSRRISTRCAIGAGALGSRMAAARKLVMSFHGVPKRTLLLGDPYHCECQKTARLLAQQLGLSEDQYLVTFQSRFGKAEWLQPYTSATVQAAGAAGRAAGRCDLPRLYQRLPGNAGRNRDGSAAGVSASGRPANFTTLPA